MCGAGRFRNGFQFSALVFTLTKAIAFARFVFIRAGDTSGRVCAGIIIFRTSGAGIIARSGGVCSLRASRAGVNGAARGIVSRAAGDAFVARHVISGIAVRPFLQYAFAFGLDIAVGACFAGYEAVSAGAGFARGNRGSAGVALPVIIVQIRQVGAGNAILCARRVGPASGFGATAVATGRYAFPEEFVIRFSGTALALFAPAFAV